MTQREPDPADPGTVIDQSPSAGPVQHGQTITLTIAEEIPPAQLTIPSNLVGMTEAEARSALRAAGFPDVTIEAESSSEFVAGLDPPGHDGAGGDGADARHGVTAIDVHPELAVVAGGLREAIEQFV